MSPKKSNADVEKPKPQPAHTMNTGKFFQAIVERRIADAEKELDTTRSVLSSTESAKGYLKALEGLLLTAKSADDKYLYLSKVEKNQKNLRREFGQQARDPLHAEFDRGFFEALEAYAKVLEHAKSSEESPSVKKEA